MTKVSQKQLQANRRNAKLGGAKTHTNKMLTKQEAQSDEIDKLRKIFMKDDFSSDDELIKAFRDLVSASKKLTPKQVEKKRKLSLELAMRYGLKNAIWVKNLSYYKYFGALGGMRHDIITEYSCKTSLELMLADRIVASYWRAMKCDMVFNHLIEKEDGGFSFDQLKVNIIKELNKGMELANRQLNANIILLKELKQPQLNVRVKTDNAYIAQNQQVVNTTKENPPQNVEGKIIKDK